MVKKIKKPHRLLFFCLFACLPLLSSAQNKYVDSLINAYDPDQGTELERVEQLRTIIWQTQDKDWEKSDIYFKKCEEIAEHSKDSSVIIEVKLISGIRNRKQQNYQLAEEQLLEVIQFSERKGDIENINRIHHHIGGVYFDVANYERAIYHSLRARDYTPPSSIRMHYNITLRLVTIYDRLGLEEDILAEWQFYLKQHPIDWPYLNAITLLRISDEFIRRIEPDSASFYADKALDIAQEEDVESMKYRAWSNLAVTSLQKQNFAKAAEYGSQASNFFDYSKRISSPIAYRYAREALAGVYLQEGDYFKAKNTYSEILESAEGTKDWESQKKATERLLELAIRSNQKEEALQLQNHLILVSDSLQKVRSDKSILRNKTEYDLEKKELQIELLKSQDEKQKLEVAKAKRNIYLALSLVLLLLSGAVFLYVSLRRKRKSQLILKKKNADINKALKERELLLKEIHHRVKNNLQVVTSLLGLQSEFITDESALSAINDGRNRVRSMALIHQNLYKEENLKGINMQDYLEKLISGLFDTYNINPGKIKLELDIQDMDLDVDTVVPIGLISNELVTNALKHAFKSKESGTISVSLKEEDKKLVLKVKDDGDGLKGVTIDDDVNSFGYQMIYAFKEKLGASMAFDDSDGHGVTLVISEYLKST